MTRRGVLLGVGFFVAATVLSSWVWGATLFGAHGNAGSAGLITIDTVTGAASPVGPFPFKCDGIAFAPDGTLYAADNTTYQLVTLDPITGAVASVIGPYGVAERIEGLAVRPTDSALFGANVVTESLYSIDTSTGALTLVGSFGTPFSTLAGLAFNLDGSVLYAIDYDFGCLFTINQATGEATTVGCGGQGPLGMARDPVTGTLYVTENDPFADTVLSIVSVADGSWTTVGTMTGYPLVEGLSFDSEVPVELILFSVE